MKALNKQNFDEIKTKSSPFTMIGDDRLNCNIKCIEYITQNNIKGDVIEIGVWKGGSILSLLLALQHMGEEREVHLYDTFSGMTPCTEVDRDFENRHADEVIKESPIFLCISHIEEVKNNISNNTDYPKNKIHYHIGDILKNKYVPENIALLRLDTDWYESTKFELETFYPNVVKGGIVIIDDYGYWKGCKKAVDEFLLEHQDIKIHKIDFTGIYFKKP